jgi:hypothetical protein
MQDQDFPLLLVRLIYIQLQGIPFRLKLQLHLELQKTMLLEKQWKLLVLLLLEDLLGKQNLKAQVLKELVQLVLQRQL